MNYYLTEFNKIASNSVLAGLCIGLAGFGFLALGGFIGQALFAVGLILIVSNSFKLYTGTAGFITSYKELLPLLTILIFNFIGVFIIASLICYASPLAPALIQSAHAIVETRIACGWLKCGLLAIGCGFLMTESVEHARNNKWLPLLFCVPLFIICGFPHCIADILYYCLSYDIVNINVIIIWFASIFGNFIGCNLKRLLRCIN